MATLYQQLVGGLLDRNAMLQYLRDAGVDPCATQVFLSLDQEAQQRILQLGPLHSAGIRNSSAVVMQRVRESHGWVPLSDDVPPASHRHVPFPRRGFESEAVEPSIIVFVRGEANRAGGNHVHETVDSFDGFLTNMEKYQRYLVEPLCATGTSRIYVMGDVKTIAGRESEVSRTMRQVFGRRFCEVRALEPMRGHNQVSSMMSSFDSMAHLISQRPHMSNLTGIYFVRADVELLEVGLHEWPRDKLCFLWYTRALRMRGTVNDIFTYVPRFLMQHFRDALANECVTVDNMHWISEVPALRAHVWCEFNLWHPSNSAKSPNPRYRISCREEGPQVETGKFVEAKLRARHDYNELQRQHQNDFGIGSPDVWSQAVKEVLRQTLTSGVSSISVHNFKSAWYTTHPLWDLSWCMPFASIGKSWECIPASRVVHCQGSGASLQWAIPSASDCGHGACRVCNSSSDLIPVWRCRQCGGAICSLHAHLRAHGKYPRCLEGCPAVEEMPPPWRNIVFQPTLAAASRTRDRSRSPTPRPKKMPRVRSVQ